MRTGDVVAVVNRITLRKRPLFDWQPATNSPRSMLQGFLSKIPLFLVASIVVLIGYYVANLFSRLANRVDAGQNSIV